MALSLADVTSAVDLAQRVDGNPARLAGRLVGLGDGEAQKLPGWSIACALVVLGFTATVLVVPALTGQRKRRVTPNVRVFS